MNQGRPDYARRTGPACPCAIVTLPPVRPKLLAITVIRSRLILVISSSGVSWRTPSRSRPNVSVGRHRQPCAGPGGDGVHLWRGFGSPARAAWSLGQVQACHQGGRYRGPAVTAGSPVPAAGAGASPACPARSPGPGSRSTPPGISGTPSWSPPNGHVGTAVLAVDCKCRGHARGLRRSPRQRHRRGRTGFVPLGFGTPNAAHLADSYSPGNKHPGTNSILRLHHNSAPCAHSPDRSGGRQRDGCDGCGLRRAPDRQDERGEHRVESASPAARRDPGFPEAGVFPEIKLPVGAAGLCPADG